jgi:hypothetical protein
MTLLFKEKKLDQSLDLFLRFLFQCQMRSNYLQKIISIIYFKLRNNKYVLLEIFWQTFYNFYLR